jgi:hypothetical protein
MIPAVGGGLCQLSNALYEAALDSGCTIIERHAHSSVIAGSAAAAGKDATVAWNYVDLRFRPIQDIRIVAWLTATDLVVRFLGHRKATLISSTLVTPELRVLTNATEHTCTDCEAQSCFRHRPLKRFTRATRRSAYLLDESWPEFIRYCGDKARDIDTIAVPMTYGRYSLVIALRDKQRITAMVPAMRRGVAMRFSQTVPDRVRLPTLRVGRDRKGVCGADSL